MSYGKSNKELSALIEKKLKNFVQNKKMRKIEKELQHIPEMPLSNDEIKKRVSSLAESVETEEISSSSNSE